MGSYPENIITQVSPVDTVVRSVIYLSMRKELAGKVFHLFNPENVSADFIFNDYRKDGMELKKVPGEEWLGQVEDLLNKGTKLPIVPYLSMFKEDIAQQPKSDENIEHQTAIDCQITLDYLKTNNIHYPPIDNELLNSYFKFISEKGD